MTQPKRNPKPRPRRDLKYPRATETEIWAAKFEPPAEPVDEALVPTRIDAKRAAPGEIRDDLAEVEESADQETIELRPEDIKKEAEFDAEKTKKEIAGSARWAEEYAKKSGEELPQDARQGFLSLGLRVKKALSSFLDRLRGLTQRLKETPEEAERAQEEEALKQRMIIEEDALERERDAYEEEVRQKLAAKEQEEEERARADIGQVEIDQSREPAEGVSFELKPEFETSPAADISPEEEAWFAKFKDGKIEREEWDKMLNELAAREYVHEAFEAAEIYGHYADAVAEMEKENNEEGLRRLIEELSIMWEEELEADGGRKPRRLRELYKKALRGEGLPEDHPGIFDFIAADIKAARKALQSIAEKKARAAAELERDIKEAYKPPERLPSEPETIPDIETRKEEILLLTKQKPESKYETILPPELIHLRNESIRQIESRLRELDRLAGSFDMRKAAGLTMNQVEREAETLLQERKELLQGFIPEDAVRERIKTAEHQIRLVAQEISELRMPEVGEPESTEEEVRRRNLLAERRAHLASLRDMRGYLEEGLPIEVEGLAAQTAAEIEPILELAKKKEAPARDEAANEVLEEWREDVASYETDKIAYINLSAELEFLKRKGKRTPSEDQRAAELRDKLGDPPKFWSRHAAQATDAEVLRIQREIVRKYFALKTESGNKTAA